MAEYIRVASLAEVPEGELRGFELPAGRIAVAHVENELFALGDECTHEGCLLSEGEVDESADTVVCPCHGSVYNIIGEYIQGPAPRGMDRFPIKIQNGRVLVDTSSVVEGPPRGILTGPAGMGSSGATGGSMPGMTQHRARAPRPRRGGRRMACRRSCGTGARGRGGASGRRRAGGSASRAPTTPRAWAACRSARAARSPPRGGRWSRRRSPSTRSWPPPAAVS